MASPGSSPIFVSSRVVGLRERLRRMSYQAPCSSSEHDEESASLSPSPKRPPRKEEEDGGVEGAAEGAAEGDGDEPVAPSKSTKLGEAMLRLLGRAPLGPTLGKVEEPPDFRNRAFDIAGDIEAGYAKESPVDFTTPLRKSGRLWRFRVLRSEDRMSARLVAESGEFLMYARTSLEKRLVSFYLYDPDLEHEKSLFNPRAPVFSMSFDENRSVWRLVQEHCENCQLVPAHLSCSLRGKQQLALIRHRRSTVGEGISNVMEVVVPGIYSDGRAMIWCPMLGRCDLCQPQDREHETQHLVTKLPTWNAEVESLVLDFKGRNIVSSAKNFQLALRQKPDHVICQYGKLSDSNFGLDFKFPLSVVQAFAIAMSTMFWV